jgi:hypothetical protein
MPDKPLLALVLTEVDRVRVELEGKLKPEVRAKLICALDKLLDRERVLRDRPLPGSRRPGPEKSKPAGPLADAFGPMGE